MSQRLEIKNPQGINTSLDPTDLPMNVWSGGINVSFKDGKSQKSSGYSPVFGTPPSGVQHLAYSIESGLLYWYEATQTQIYRTDGTSHVDMTRAAGGLYSASSDHWNSTTLNTVLIMNNGVDVPQSKTIADAKFINLPNWPATLRAEVVRSYKNYLVALNTNVGGTDYPTTVRWSSPADPGQVPFTWDLTDATNDAGETFLSGTPGAIVDGRKLRDAFIIYKEDSVHAMNYIGGTFVFSFRQLFDDVGALSRDCIAEFDGKHFVVGQGDVYVHNGVEKKSVIKGVMREYLFSTIKSENAQRTFVVPDYSNTEMWVCYNSSDNNDNEGCDKALIWNWSENTWSIRQLPDIRHAVFGIVDPQEPDDWDSALGSWDTEALSWGESNYNPSRLKILMTSELNSKVYLVGNTSVFDDVVFSSTVERLGMSFGDDRQIKFVSSITPHVSGTGVMDVYIGSQYIQNGPVTWKGPYSYTIGEQFKVDCRLSGRYVAIKFVSSSLSDWFLSGYTLEFENISGRR